MMFDFRSLMAEIHGITLDDDNTGIKKRVRASAQYLRNETDLFLEHSIEIQGEHPERPRLPMWFTIAFNELKSELNSINHQDSLLNMFPRMTQMGLLTQFGENDDFPKQGENGLLEEDQNTMEYQIHQFLKDVTVYVWNAHVFTKQVKDLPKVYFITLDYFKRKAESEEMKHLVQMVPILLQTYIQHFVGIQNIGIDYVQRCTFQHNQWIKSFDN
ncbi:hypothetical protein B9Z55_029119 [Caenorhabditis nigoni]|uniref:Uncharacterized protein n=1 Tax=Caenorhabditis nigoni TaxID=1611254 RepID=A0A2G5S8Y6_9PELO|nr:hypothetical protein B9Z55_029119 [Caenorhabditis nigoni]